MAAVNALKSYRIESKLVLDCIEALTAVAQNNQITIIWVPAHSNIEGNDIADRLAKKGAHQTAYGPEPFFPFSERRCRAICEKELYEKMVQRWCNTEVASHTKKFIITPCVKLTEQLMNSSKLQLSFTIGILTGHIRLNKYLRKIGVRDDPDCDYCGRAEESAHHFLCECPALSQIRRITYNKDILTANEVMSTQLRKIFHFVRRSGRFPILENYPIRLRALFGQDQRHFAINASLAVGQMS